MLFDPAKMLTPAEVALRFGVSVRTLSNWSREGRIPEPLRLSPRTVRFSGDDLNIAIGQFRAEALRVSPASPEVSPCQ